MCVKIRADIWNRNILRHVSLLVVKHRPVKHDDRYGDSTSFQYWPDHTTQRNHWGIPIRRVLLKDTSNDYSWTQVWYRWPQESIPCVACAHELFWLLSIISFAMGHSESSWCSAGIHQVNNFRCNFVKSFLYNDVLHIVPASWDFTSCCKSS